MNRNFAKPKADLTPEFAPDVLVLDGRTILAPKAVHYAAAGYLPLRDERPTASEIAANYAVDKARFGLP